MNTPPDYALEIARGIFNTDHDNANLDLMAIGLDASTAIEVYEALEWLHEKELESEDKQS